MVTENSGVKGILSPANWSSHSAEVHTLSALPDQQQHFGQRRLISGPAAVEYGRAQL